MELDTRTLNEAQFATFQNFLRDSVSKTLHNLVTIFVLKVLYDKAPEKEQEMFKNFLNTAVDEVKKIHTLKAATHYDLSDKQKELFEEDMNEVINNCLDPVTNIRNKE